MEVVTGCDEASAWPRRSYLGPTTHALDSISRACMSTATVACPSALVFKARLATFEPAAADEAAAVANLFNMCWCPHCLKDNVFEYVSKTEDDCCTG
jgi:hypothetical protein